MYIAFYFILFPDFITTMLCLRFDTADIKRILYCIVLYLTHPEEICTRKLRTLLASKSKPKINLL